MENAGSFRMSTQEEQHRSPALSLGTSFSVSMAGRLFRRNIRYSPWASKQVWRFVDRSDQRRTVTVEVARPKGKKLHFVEPTLVEARQARDGLGYLKIAMFPGMIGVEVANEISRAVEQLGLQSIALSSTCVATPAEGSAHFV